MARRRTRIWRSRYRFGEGERWFVLARRWFGRALRGFMPARPSVRHL